jgi:hypothetical protein
VARRQRGNARLHGVFDAERKLHSIEHLGVHCPVVTLELVGDFEHPRLMVDVHDLLEHCRVPGAKDHGFVDERIEVGLLAAR